MSALDPPLPGATGPGGRNGRAPSPPPARPPWRRRPPAASGRGRDGPRQPRAGRRPPGAADRL